MEKNEKRYFSYDNDIRKIKVEVENIDFDSEGTIRTKPKNNKKLKIVIAAVVAVLVVVLGVLITIKESKRREENSLVFTEDWITVYYYSYYGDVSIRGELTEKFFTRCEEVFGNREDAKNDSEYVHNQTGELSYACSFYIDNISELYIGDTATITVEVNKAIQKELGVYVTGGTFTVEVTGKIIGEEPEKLSNPIDVVQVYEVHYNGEAHYIPYYPSIMLYDITGNDFISTVIEDGEDLTVSVKLSEDAIAMLERDNVDVSKTERIFTKEEITRIAIDDYEKIDAEFVDVIKEKANSAIVALYRGYNKSLVVDSVNYFGGWVSTYEDANLFNKVVGIYEIKVSHKEDKIEPLSLFIRFEMENVVFDNTKNEYIYDVSGLNDNINTKVSIDDEQISIEGATSLEKLLARETLPSRQAHVIFDSNGNLQAFE